jgi:hypothetical protein
MLCSTCGTEIGDALECPACRLAVDRTAPSAAAEAHGGGRRSLFSATAWLELRVRSVFVNNPRGFSDTLERGRR